MTDKSWNEDLQSGLDFDLTWCQMEQRHLQFARELVARVLEMRRAVHCSYLAEAAPEEVGFGPTW
jgi:hypothetical protein